MKNTNITTENLFGILLKLFKCSYVKYRQVLKVNFTITKYECIRKVLFRMIHILPKKNVDCK